MWPFKPKPREHLVNQQGHSLTLDREGQRVILGKHYTRWMAHFSYWDLITILMEQEYRKEQRLEQLEKSEDMSLHERLAVEDAFHHWRSTANPEMSEVPSDSACNVVTWLMGSGVGYLEEMYRRTH